jgi:putative FmdB family regulatory protein
MPIYRFRCMTCQIESDEFRKVDSRDDAPDCPRGHGLMIRRLMPTMVQADIQPYRAVCVDKETGKLPVIQSRKQHREFLRRNDYVEVGNDPIREPKRDSNEPDAPMLSVEQLKQQGFIEEAL